MLSMGAPIASKEKAMTRQPVETRNGRILALLATLVLGLALVPGEARAQADQAGAETVARVDLLSMGAGAFPIRYDDATQRTLSRAVLDGLPGYSVIDRSPTGPEEPLVLIVELAAPTVFREFGVPPMSSFGCCVGTLVARITVEGSIESPDAGFERLAVLEPRADEFQAEQFFPVEAEHRVRWVRISLEGRQDPDPDDYRGTSFTDLIGLGTQEPRPDVPGEFSGIFLTGGGAGGGAGNRMELLHEGALVTGCRQSGGAVRSISGGVENGILKLTAPDGIPTLLVINSEGQLRGNEIGRAYGPIIGEPGGNPTPCSEPGDRPNPVAEALDEGRVAIVYGINFDVDSDALRPDAGPALEQILAALEQAPDVSITIEGHTDSDGSDAHNLDLSQRRAESVAAWLVERGVAASRLEAVGRGESDPIADNASDAGKAANRRVEIEGR
jgi:outer membrane protein OmpA-like peptidoglycan-associated protein